MSQELDAQFFRRFSWIILVLFFISFTMVFLAREFGAQVVDRSADTLAERMAPVGQVNTDPDAPAMAAKALKTAQKEAATSVAAQAEAQAAELGAIAAEAQAAATQAQRDAEQALVAAAGGETALGANPGKAIYEQACFACHATPVLGAPVLGSKADWAPRLEKGFDMLFSNVIDGYTGENGIMPPKGGFAHLTDQNVRDALIFMLQESGGDALIPTNTESGDAPATEAVPETSSTASAAQVMPIAQATQQAPAPGEDLAKGKEVYDSACFICHTPGAAGAPKHGDSTAWAGRLDQGLPVLHDHAIKGYMGKAGLMPPKGGRVDLSDDDVKAAVAYMLAEVK